MIRTETTKTPRVVVGVDDSPAARWALAWAVAYARQRDLPLHIVHAIQPPRAGCWMTGVPFPTYVATLQHECAVALRALLADTAPPPEMKVTTACPYGRPGRTLTRLAHEGDLLVIGRGAGGRLSRLITRSVHAYCARHATASLVTISTPSLPAFESPARDAPVSFERQDVAH
ncbi:MAG TPA: universal stress protein [Streptosporangiaceae bacterium]